MFGWKKNELFSSKKSTPSSDADRMKGELLRKKLQYPYAIYESI